MSLQRADAPDPYDFLPPVPSFTVTSEDMRDGAPLTIERVYAGAGGKNESPHLSWSGAPEGTRGYAVTRLDPDAPTGTGAWHWLLVNLSASVTELPRGTGSRAEPPVGGFHIRNDLGGFGYDGAHRRPATSRTATCSWSRPGHRRARGHPGNQCSVRRLPHHRAYPGQSDPHTNLPALTWHVEHC